MANPVALTGLPGQPLKGGEAAGGKTAPSQFDKVAGAVRSRQQAPPLPPAVTDISAAQRQVLASELRKKVEQPGVKPQESFRADLKNAGSNMNRLSKRIEALPKTSAMEPIRTRFAAIEKQFVASNDMLGNIGAANSPGNLLKLQVQIYQLTQNIEIVSKVVDEVNSGVKQILQTQVS